jgi:hypothetical protein
MGKLGQTTSPLVASIAAAITQMEGTIAPNAQYPNGSLAYQNNNPGNLQMTNPPQPGASPGAGGFAKFDSVADGQAALYNQIQYQINSGQNLTQFFNQYAPGGTSNAAGGVQTSAATQNYINTVAQQTGIDPSIPLNSIQSSYTGPGSIVASSTNTSDTSGNNEAGTLDLSGITDALSSIDFSDPATLITASAIGVAVLYAIFA